LRRWQAAIPMRLYYRQGRIFSMQAAQLSSVQRWSILIGSVMLSLSMACGRASAFPAPICMTRSQRRLLAGDRDPEHRLGPHQPFIGMFADRWLALVMLARPGLCRRLVIMISDTA